MKNRIKERLWLCAALAALLLAAGCGAQESGGSHLESDDAALAQTVSVGQGDAAIALSLPAGWNIARRKNRRRRASAMTAPWCSGRRIRRRAR